MSRARSVRGYLFVALAAVIATACSGEKGVVQAQTGEAMITLSEGPCFGTCPIYDMTLKPNGDYILNAERFVKAEGVREGNMGGQAYMDAEEALRNAGFWSIEPEQTMDTLHNCHTDAPTTKITWRDAEGKEKTVTYNAGCGVQKMNDLIRSLRAAMKFEELVWTDDRFDPSGNR